MARRYPSPGKFLLDTFLQRKKNLTVQVSIGLENSCHTALVGGWIENVAGLWANEIQVPEAEGSIHQLSTGQFDLLSQVIVQFNRTFRLCLQGKQTCHSENVCSSSVQQMMTRLGFSR